jgi:hypothetical protein
MTSFIFPPKKEAEIALTHQGTKQINSNDYVRRKESK